MNLLFLLGRSFIPGPFCHLPCLTTLFDGYAFVANTSSWAGSWLSRCQSAVHLKSRYRTCQRLGLDEKHLKQQHLFCGRNGFITFNKSARERERKRLAPSPQFSHILGQIWTWLCVLQSYGGTENAEIYLGFFSPLWGLKGVNAPEWEGTMHTSVCSSMFYLRTTMHLCLCFMVV